MMNGTVTNGKTKMIQVNMPTTRSWKLRPEELTLIKLGLENLDLPILDKAKKSLLKRMKGDFFMKLYATGRWSSEEIVESEPETETGTGASSSIIIPDETISSTIRTDRVRRLSTESGCGLVQCRQALEAASWDYSKALEHLRTSGLAGNSMKAPNNPV